MNEMYWILKTKLELLTSKKTIALYFFSNLNNRKKNFSKLFKIFLYLDFKNPFAANLNLNLDHRRERKNGRESICEMFSHKKTWFWNKMMRNLWLLFKPSTSTKITIQWGIKKSFTVEYQVHTNESVDQVLGRPRSGNIEFPTTKFRVSDTPCSKYLFRR